jgi:glutamine amidotransferase
LIGIVDYGVGNLASLAGALKRVGAEPVVSADPATLMQCAKLILPGVGAFGEAMRQLQDRGLVEPLTRYAMTDRRPVLGICLGCQLFATVGEEFGEHRGLGWIDARCVRLEAGDRGFLLPHVGWNDLTARRASALLDELSPDTLFYYVHSYHVVPADPELVVATCDYGGPVNAMLEQQNLFAVQFHPEKSQQGGLTLLRNFVHRL